MGSETIGTFCSQLAEVHGEKAVSNLASLSRLVLREVIVTTAF
jgi:hypothetical protein